MPIHRAQGDLLDQPVDVIVNPWNCNIIPWWLLWLQGVSGAIKRKAGSEPFRQVARHGVMPVGDAVFTSAGNLPYKGIVHVAGINMCWRSSGSMVRKAVRGAMSVVIGKNFRSVAFPLIGAGSGAGTPERVEAIIAEELSLIPYDGDIYIVRYGKP